MSASTGSGKTLAYTLPIIQNMILEEQNGYIRQNHAPRGVILVPTRELAKQVISFFFLFFSFLKDKIFSSFIFNVFLLLDFNRN